MHVKMMSPIPPEARTHILVVEDEFLVRMMLSDILREAGYSVTEAECGDQALKILSEELPDLIITDVRMPGECDGLQLVDKVRATNSALPIIVTSAHLVQISELHEGPTHFLSKPYDFDTVINLVAAELKA